MWYTAYGVTLFEFYSRKWMEGHQGRTGACRQVADEHQSTHDTTPRTVTQEPTHMKRCTSEKEDVPGPPLTRNIGTQTLLSLAPGVKITKVSLISRSQ